MNENIIASTIIGAAINVHKALGIGMNESTYVACLIHELESRSLRVETNVDIPVYYKNLVVNSAATIEILVENKVFLQPKFVNVFAEKDMLKMKSILQATDLKLGVMINFNSKFIKGDAIRRVVNGLIEEDNSDDIQLPNRRIAI